MAGGWFGLVWFGFDDLAVGLQLGWKEKSGEGREGEWFFFAGRSLPDAGGTGRLEVGWFWWAWWFFWLGKEDQDMIQEVHTLHCWVFIVYAATEMKRCKC
jgi:hypothetical protein